MSETVPSLAWDIFCRVIDNYGDVGVCWRLARQLTREYRQRVRLWLDELPSLARLWPGVDVAAECQVVDDIELRHWRADTEVETLGEVVIEAFACELPATALARMREAARTPLWLNLEYLSAETWIEGCHLLPSPQPGGLAKTFFFPGFTPATGGLLAEAEALRARAAWGEAQARAWLAARGVASPPGARRLSLFAYDNAALPGLLQTWARGRAPWHALVPEGYSLPQLAEWLGTPLAAGDRAARGALTVSVLPFLHQDDYDRLLWSCDLNFVRGEDSFVRAQWAHTPCVWHIYRQAEDAHLYKLEAWLARYLADAPLEAAAACAGFVRAWNREAGAAEAWPAFAAALPMLAAHAGSWAEHLRAHGELAGKLLAFAQSRLSG